MHGLIEQSYLGDLMSFKFNPISGTLDIVGVPSPPVAITYETYDGGDLVGNQLFCGITPLFIILERQLLTPEVDYTNAGTVVTFNVDVDVTSTIVVFG